MSIGYVVTIPKDLKLEHIFEDSVAMSDYMLYNEVDKDTMYLFLEEFKRNLFTREEGHFQNKHLFKALRRYFRKKELILGTIETNEESDMLINLDYNYIKDMTRHCFQKEGLVNNIERKV